jgi:hypothetical protein
VEVVLHGETDAAVNLDAVLRVAPGRLPRRGFRNMDRSVTVVIVGVDGDKGSAVPRMFQARRLKVAPDGKREYQVSGMLFGARANARSLTSHEAERRVSKRELSPGDRDRDRTRLPRCHPFARWLRTGSPGSSTGPASISPTGDCDSVRR